MMQAFLPIAAAALQAGSFVLDKTILSMRRVSERTYLGASYPIMFVIALALFAVFRPPLSVDMVRGPIFYVLAASIIISIIQNLIFYQALHADRLTEVETVSLLKNIPLAIFAALIFPEERNIAVLIGAVFATGAIFWSHYEHHRFNMDAHTFTFTLWIIIFAPLGAILTKILLETWHPISLELVRIGASALILGPLFMRDERSITPKAFVLLVLTNTLTTVAHVLYSASFQVAGIVYTTLFFSFEPLLTYFGALVFLREKFYAKRFVAFLVILASIVIAGMA